MEHIYFCQDHAPQSGGEFVLASPSRKKTCSVCGVKTRYPYRVTNQSNDKPVPVTDTSLSNDDDWNEDEFPFD